jgi:hypothetical protein
MNLKDILAISGESTLFKFVAQGKNAVIVENLETGRRFSAGAHLRVSALDEISIFTSGEDMPLGNVMDRLWDKESGGEAISHRQPDAELKKYFAEVLPEYDRDRVYTSDIKKVLHWYNILHGLNLLVKEEPQEEEQKSGEEDNEKAASDAATTDKPSARPVKAAPKKKPASSASKSANKKPAAGSPDGNK